MIECRTNHQLPSWSGLSGDGFYVRLGNLRSARDCIDQLILGHLGHIDSFVTAREASTQMRM
jgi:hypothetical protein